MTSSSSSASLLSPQMRDFLKIKTYYHCLFVILYNYIKHVLDALLGFGLKIKTNKIAGLLSQFKKLNKKVFYVQINI